MNNKVKFSWKQYYEVTPKNLRKWGDGWALFWLTIAGCAALSMHPYWTVGFNILAAAGKALSNFFTTEEIAS